MKEQIDAWVKNNQQQKEFWERTAESAALSAGMHVTQEEAKGLARYFAGCLDLASMVQQFAQQQGLYRPAAELKRHLALTSPPAASSL